MKYLFDFGNSSLKWAVSNQGLDKTGVIRYSKSSNLSTGLDQACIDPSTPEEVWISSVAGAVATQELKDWVYSKWSMNAQEIQAVANGYGISSNYDSPAQLGSDRWAAMIAIRHRYTQPATIVDCGTAVTIDFLKDDQFHGGVIIPGLDIWRKSLLMNTAGIKTDSTEVVSSIATNTSTAVHSGTLFGLAGAIDNIIKQQQHDMGCSSTVYLTGGSATQLLPYFSFESVHIPDLVLQGIEVIAEAGA